MKPLSQQKAPIGIFTYFQGACIGVFCIAAVYTLIQIYYHIPSGTNILFLFLQIIGGLFLALATADFASGLVHFIFDNFGDEKTPFFGPHFIKPFREHHGKPQEITHHGFLETNGLNFLGVLPLMALLYLWLRFLPLEKNVSMFGGLYGWFFLVAISLTNQIHKWAHSAKRPAFITVLQNMRLILPFNHHTVHHSFDHDKYYCITTGWLNPLLTKIYFFEGILKLFKRQ